MGTLDLREKFADRTAKVSVIGLGYVGLPLALDLAQAGFEVHGVDTDQVKVAKLKNSRSYVIDVPDSDVKRAVEALSFRPTSDFDSLKDSDVVIICVPTPLRKSKDPDISYILSAMSEISQRLHSDMLIILESTTYPGTTEELIATQVTERGFVVGKHVFVCYSPERVDPGNVQFRTRNTPRIVGGVTSECTDLGVAFYSNIIEKVFPVSSARVAETAKLLENTFRSVNIALVNEMALMAERMGIDVWEVIDAAATKPYGYMPFYPGPGLGGHCIPLDPMYLSWKAKSHGFHNKFIELATDINGNMPRYVVDKLAQILNLERKAINGSRILILGMAYKRDVSDTRESPSLEIYKLLEFQGAKVEYHDPFVPSFTDGAREFRSTTLSLASLSSYDCVILATNHTQFDYENIAKHARLILDTRNAFRNCPAQHIIRLGQPTPSALKWNESRLETVPAAAAVDD